LVRGGAECGDYPGQRLWKWAEDGRYNVGDLAVYAGFVYEAVHANAGCQPPVNPIIWRVVGRA